MKNARAPVELVAPMCCVAVRTPNTEPPVTRPGCASAAPQLYSISHSNPRDWEFPTRRTFLNNEGILCLQYSARLSRTFGDALHAKGRRKHEFSWRLLPDHMPCDQYPFRWLCLSRAGVKRGALQSRKRPPNWSWPAFTRRPSFTADAPEPHVMSLEHRNSFQATEDRLARQCWTQHCCKDDVTPCCISHRHHCNATLDTFLSFPPSLLAPLNPTTMFVPRFCL